MIRPKPYPWPLLNIFWLRALFLTELIPILKGDDHGYSPEDGIYSLRNTINQ